VKVAYCFGLWTWTKADGIFRSTHLCWLHISPEWERHCQVTSCLAGHPCCHQLKQGGCWVGKVEIKQLGRSVSDYYYYYYKRWCLKWHYHAQTLQGHLTKTKQVTWCDCCDCDMELKLVLQCYQHVLDGVAAPCHRGPLGWHQMTVIEIIIAVLYHFVRLCNCWCEFGLCQWATHMWDVPQHDW